MADQLEDYAAFIAIADHGSLTAAAKALGRSLQAVSRSLARLEDTLGTSLVLRTTRRSQVTAAGLVFRDRLKAALAEIELARAEAARHGEVVSGRLRVAASVLFAPAYVVPAASAFMQRWPGVEIELVQSDQFADLVSERIDIAVRIGEDLKDVAEPRIGSGHRGDGTRGAARTGRQHVVLGIFISDEQLTGSIEAHRTGHR